MKTYNLHIISLLILISISIISCVKEENSNTEIEGTTYESLEIIETTLNGIVLDDEGNPVVGAFINVDNAHTVASTTTDDNGYYELLEIEVRGRLANVSIMADNIFDSEYKATVTKGSVSKADFIVNKYTSIGSFMSTQDRSLSSQDGVTIDFRANSIVTSSGDEYDGEVVVFASRINPLERKVTDHQFGGDIGEDASFYKGAIYQYQTIQVELKSPAGELLNIKEGHTAKLTIESVDGAPAGLSNSDLAMMYYDEEDNIWKEEATGELVGNSWVAELPHFSTWTWCTIMANSIPGSGRVQLFDMGRPYASTIYVVVEYQFADGREMRFSGNTSYDGSFYFRYGIVDHPFTFRILNNCQQEIYSQEYTSVPTGEVDFGNIVVDTPENYSKELSVSVFNCDDTPVDVGFSQFCIKGFDFDRCQILPIEDGLVKYDFLSCSGGLEGYLYLLNQETWMTTSPIKVDLDDNDVIIDYVTLCDTFKNNFTVNLNGSQYYSYRRVSYGGTQGSDGSRTQILSSANEHASINFQITNSFDDLGSYTFEQIGIYDADSTFQIRMSRPNTITFELEEFEPNLATPDIFSKYPEHLKASFSGMVEYMDPVTEEVLGTYPIDGTILID